ncbi:hypothetical protein MPSEU_000634800 [Mayamaea pseudoterrestris]|nr:hypothetical protein MPSEU_000634800 [Mayamaea pseudoterrestris]
MTADVRGSASVGAFVLVPYNFQKNNEDMAFCMSIGYRIYGEEFESADGMAFVMHQDPRGAAATGGGGGLFGAYGLNAITNSRVIEWDTYDNGPDSKYPVDVNDVDDVGEDNVHIQTVSADGTLTQLEQIFGDLIRTLDDGTPGRMWVEYRDGVLTVWSNNMGNDFPATPIVSMHMIFRRF